MPNKTAPVSPFARFLRACRTEQGISQAELARRIVTRSGKPLNASAVARWEAETRPSFTPDSHSLAQLSAALDTPIQAFVAAAHPGVQSVTEADSLATLSRWQVQAASELDLSPIVSEMVVDALSHARRVERELRSRQG